MSSINSVGGSNPLYRATPNKPASAPADVQTKPTAGGDKVELSNVDRLMTQLKTNDIRVDKVASIRAQIEAGTYETDEKLQAAADRMLDDVL